MGVAGASRDLEELRSGLERWLISHRPRDLGLSVGPLTKPNDGLSSETVFVDVTWRSGSESLVARLPPAGGGIFPFYDLALQARLQAALPALGIPTAPPVVFEEDVSWVGASFLVMPRIPGRLLTDNPPYARHGWLKEAGPEVQRAIYGGFVDTLADIHRLDWRGLEWAARAGGPGLGPELDWWDAYLTWAGEVPVALLAAQAWCRAHRPDPEPPPSLLWGDVRLGNVIFGDDHRPAAVLDWEMATVGPAEVDLGWFFALRDLGLPPGGVELPGFLDRSATLERYQQRLGRAVGDLAWYEVFALVRSTAVLARMQALLVEQGQGDHWLVGFDPVPPRLTELAGS
jgi:aminoglycoside phosphotransferase (APT) family kinase protein